MDTSINAFIPIGASLFLSMGAYALARGRRKPAGEAEPTRATEEVPEELELLRYENAMLRAEQQRTLSLGKAGERVREHLANVVTSGTDEGDDAWSALTEATVLRDTVLTVCRDLETALRHVQTQLSSGVPITELDRRRSDREPQATAPVDGAHTVTPLPDRTGHGLPLVEETGT